MFKNPVSWAKIEIHDPHRYDFPPDWNDPVYFIKCTWPCLREERPLACRFFPLTPHLLSDGILILTYERTPLPYSCPLITKQAALSDDFIITVARAWQMLLKEPLVRSLVLMDSRVREQVSCKPPEIIWRANA